MSLKYVLLTLLHRKQQTGYEIVRSFDSAIGYFWNASHQQVYRELGTLTDARLVRFRQIKQAEKPDKKIYTISAMGKKELQAWLETPVKAQVNKDLLLVKLLNTTEKNVSLMLDEINEGIRRSEQLSKVYNHIEEQYYSANQLRGLALEDKMLYVALRKGLHGVEAHMKWLCEVRLMLESA